MMTTVFDIDDETTAAEVASLLLDGKVGILPCDTIYGLSAIANEATADEIFQIKRRPQSKSLITLMSLEAAAASELDIPDDILSTWPAPLTAIVNGKDGATHAVRVPADSFIQRVLAISGPIWSTSVNFSGERSLVTFDDIYPVFNNIVSFIVRKKESKDSALPSTLIDCTVHPYRIIRQGAFDASALI